MFSISKESENSELFRAILITVCAQELFNLMQCLLSSHNNCARKRGKRPRVPSSPCWEISRNHARFVCRLVLFHSCCTQQYQRQLFRSGTARGELTEAWRRIITPVSSSSGKFRFEMLMKAKWTFFDRPGFHNNKKLTKRWEI